MAATSVDFWDALGGSAVSDITHELIWARGPDSVAFTDSLLSQNVAAMTPGEVERSFLLAPNGKLRALLWVLRGEDEVGLVSDVGGAGTVASDLNRFKLRVDVTIDPEAVPLYSLVGRDLGADEGWDRSGDVVTIRADLGPLQRTLTSAHPADLPLLSAELADALRIEAGEPRMGVDVDESTIPQETGLVDDAVDFDKGCYLGQELVARIDSRGHVNQRLVGVASAVAPGTSAVVSTEEREVGRLTSVAWSPALGEFIGMGMLRREAPVGSAVSVRWEDGETPGRVISLPLAED